MAFRPLFTSSVLVGCRHFGTKGVTRPFAPRMMGGNPLWGSTAGGRNTYLQAQVFSTPFSTGTNTDPIAKVDYGDIQTLMERDHYVKIKKRLEKDSRKTISLQEYQTIATEEGLSTEQASRLLQSLSDAGIILYFPQSANSKLQNSVFLKPQELNTTIHNLLDHYSPAALKIQAEVIQAEIKDIIVQLEPLKQIRDVLDHKAHRRATTIIVAGFGYCILQFLAIGRLTWWELSWDVMEPVTYMLTFATALIGYSYFVATGSEYTFEGLKKTLRERRLKKLIKKSGFDEAKFVQLHKALHIKEEQLHKLLEEFAHAGPAIHSIKHLGQPVPPIPPLFVPGIEAKPTDAKPTTTV